MLLVAWRDLQFRKRRYAISIVAAALVFGMTLVLSGLAASFDSEIDRTLSTLGADHWVVGANATGPFLGSTPLPATAVDQMRSTPGVTRADALAFRNLTVDNPKKTGVLAFGVDPGGLVAPKVATGQLPQKPGETAVEQRLGYKLGERFTMGGSEFVVVGLIDGSTLMGGTPVAFIGVADLQKAGYAGAPIISSVAMQGRPSTVPASMKVMDGEDARGDLVRPLQPARDAVAFVSILLWLVAICIIGSVIYLSAVERVRDFAVLKATGTSNGGLLGGLVSQAIFVSLVAALIATALAYALAPLFPIPMDIPATSAIALPVAALIAGCLASIAGVRRAIVVDPALAFGGP